MIANNFIVFVLVSFFSASVFWFMARYVISLFWSYVLFIPFFYFLLDLPINKYQVTFANANIFPMYFFSSFRVRLFRRIFLLFFVHFIHSVRYCVCNSFFPISLYVVFHFPTERACETEKTVSKLFMYAVDSIKEMWMSLDEPKNRRE